MKQKRGFTLVEAVISMSVISLLLVPAVGAITTASRARGLRNLQRQSAELGKELLTQIMQCYYVLPAGVTDGTTQPTWVLISDYNGLTEVGNAPAGLTGWTRTVLVELVNPANPGGATVGSDLGMKRITVTVTSGAGLVTKMVGLRSSAGPTDRKSPAALPYVSWIDISLDGGGTAKAVSAVNLINQVP